MMTDMNMEAESFYASYLPTALELAIDHAGADGFVASMPDLLHARVDADYDNFIWNTWFTTNSEENIVNTPAGNKALVSVHGGGIFGVPARFRKLFHADVNRHNDIGYTGLFAGKITNKEAAAILEGKLLDGTEMPMYDYDDFAKGINDLPRRYGVVMDYDTAKNSITGMAPFDALKADPMMIVRAGGPQAAARYLDKAQKRHGTSQMGSWHSYDNRQVNPEELQTTNLLLSGNQGGVDSDIEDDHIRGYDSDFGLRSGVTMVYCSRYVAVAPRDAATSVRHLPFC